MGQVRMERVLDTTDDRETHIRTSMRPTHGLPNGSHGKVGQHQALGEARSHGNALTHD